MEGMFGGLVGNTIASDAVGADSLPAGPGVGALGAGRVAAGAQWARWTLVALTPPTVVRLFVRSAFKLNVLHPGAFAEVECPPVRATAHPFATAAARYVLAETPQVATIGWSVRALTIANGAGLMRLVAGGELADAQATTEEEP